jgi:hypothetical protein
LAWGKRAFSSQLGKRVKQLNNDLKQTKTEDYKNSKAVNGISVLRPIQSFPFSHSHSVIPIQ